MNVALLPTPKLPPRHLHLQAIVYVRQSTQRQLLEPGGHASAVSVGRAGEAGGLAIAASCINGQ